MGSGKTNSSLNTSEHEVKKWDLKLKQYSKSDLNSSSNKFMDLDATNEAELRKACDNQSLRKIPSFKDFKRLKHVDDISELYDLSIVLGQGQFGKVYKAKRKQIDNNTYCAVKCIYKD